jgi:hypothetical protein
MPSASRRLAPDAGAIDEAMNEPALVEPMDFAIAGVAYRLWLERGCPHGSDQEDWFRAEEILKAKST